MSEDLRDDSEDNGENVASDDAVSKHSEQRDSQSPATSSSSIASDSPPAERRVTRQRGGTKMVCAVSCCDGSSESDASLRFFQMPSGNQMKRRSSWIRAVPELENAISAHYRNVCSRHFVDGEPTTDNPAPTLLLTKDTPKPVTRKRKSLAMENDEAKLKVKEEVKEEPIEEEEETVNDAPSLKASAKAKGSTPTSMTPEVINFRTLSGKPVSSYSPSSVLRVAGEDGKTKFVRVIKKTGPPTATDTLSTTPPHMTEGDSEGISTGLTLSSILAPILNNTSSNNIDVGNSRTPLFQPVSGRASLPVTDEGCTHCLTAVPKVRRDLGRVEARLDAMVGMVKALLQQQSVRRVHVVSASNGNSVACRIPSSTPLRVQSVARAAAGVDSVSGTGSARISFAPLAPGGVKPGSVKPVSTASPSTTSMRFVTASSLKAPGSTPSSSSATATVTIKEKPLSLSGMLPTRTCLLPAVVALNTRVAKTILMMRGSTFTLHFARHNAPGLSQVSDKALVDCVKMLEEDGLINLDPNSRGKPYLDPSTTFRKALSPSEESLDKYGLTLAQYKSILVRPKVTVFKKAT